MKDGDARTARNRRDCDARAELFGSFGANVLGMGIRVYIKKRDDGTLGVTGGSMEGISPGSHK